MDIRAFGSVFGQTSVLPYGSGISWQTSDGERRFPTSRGVYMCGTGNQTVYVELSDAPGQYTPITTSAPCLLNLACTAISGGAASSAVVLF